MPVSLNLSARCSTRALIALLCTLGLAGCGIEGTPSTGGPPADVMGAALHGVLHGGQQAITGAHIYLFAANTTGYGGAGTAPSALNASVSLLKNVAGSTALDSSGGATNGDYFVTTDTNGNWSITSDYTCTPNTQVYLYALGGNTGSGVNADASALALLGNCPTADVFPSTTFVGINEVSTVAAAYALAGFATDATHVSSSGTALAQTGIANAFANAANLVNLASASALTTTPNGNGAVPQTTIDTLANILASCINTVPSTSTACATLFANAQNAGVTPTETATAAINIAHNPAANIANLYGLPVSSPPFQPALTAQPNDFTLSIVYTGSGIVNGNTQFDLAVDAAGSVWAFAYPYTLTKFSSLGVLQSPATGYAALPAVLATADNFALDSSGDAWIPVSTNVSPSYGVIELNPSGSLISPAGGYTGSSLNAPFAAAFDSSGNIWVVNFPNFSTTPITTERLVEFSSTGALLSPAAGYPGAGLTGAEQLNNIAIAGNGGNIWVPNVETNVLSGFSASGAPLSSSGSTGAGMNQPKHVAVDSSGNVWVASQHGSALSKFTSAGVAVNSSGYTGGGLGTGGFNSQSLALDGLGNAWTLNIGGGCSVTTDTCPPSLLTAHTSAGVAFSPSTGFQLPVNDVQAMAIDGSGSIWSYGVTFYYQGSTSPVALPVLTQTIGIAAPVVTPLALAVKNNTLATRP